MLGKSFGDDAVNVAGQFARAHQLRAQLRAPADRRPPSPAVAGSACRESAARENSTQYPPAPGDLERIQQQIVGRGLRDDLEP